MLSIRFIGIVSHIAPRPGQDTFYKRAVLSRSRPDSKNRHTGYVEIETADLAFADFTPEPPYVRGFTEYVKFDLDGDEIIIDPVDPSLPFFEADNFLELVPSAARVAPSLDLDLNPECFDPKGDLISGYYDMPAGILVAGEREQIATRFTPQGDWPKQRNAFWTQLLVRTKPGAPPTITLRSLRNGTKRTIQLRMNTAAITIGNQPPEEIAGNPHPTLPTREHFALHYRLAATDAQSVCPVPEEVHTAVNGCLPVRYP
jgi:hypothetical protein